MKNTHVQDEKIKEMLNSYRENHNNISDIIEYLSSTIYSFPYLTSGMDADACSDFYEYILVRMSKILSGYSQMECKFLTWFMVVLRRHFYNWIKHSKLKENREYAILNSPVNFDSKDELINSIKDESIGDDLIEGEAASTVVKAFDMLPERESLILKLHYFDFFQENDLHLASELFECSLSEMKKRYDAIRNKIADKNETIFSLQEKVIHSHHKKLSLIEKVQKSPEAANDGQFDHKIRNIHSSHKKYLGRLENTYTSIKNKDIAFLLGVNAKIVANSLFRGKKMLAKILQKELKVV